MLKIKNNSKLSKMKFEKLVLHLDDFIGSDDNNVDVLSNEDTYGEMLNDLEFRFSEDIYEEEYVDDIIKLFFKELHKNNVVCVIHNEIDEDGLECGETYQNYFIYLNGNWRNIFRDIDLIIEKVR